MRSNGRFRLFQLFSVILCFPTFSGGDYPLTAKFALVGSWQGVCTRCEESGNWNFRFSLSYRAGETFVIERGPQRWTGSCSPAKGRPERERDDLGFVFDFREPFFGAKSVAGYVNVTLIDPQHVQLGLLPPGTADVQFPSAFALEKHNYPEQVHLAYGRDPTTTMTVAWASPRQTASVVLYAEYDKANKTDWRTAKGNIARRYTAYDYYKSPYFHWVVLEGLLPGTQYAYRCGDPAHGFSRLFTFRTAPNADAYNVTIWGDSNLMGTVSGWGRSWERSRQVMTSVSRDPSLFVFAVGDMTYCHGRHECWDNFFNDIEEYAAVKPLMVCVGNHDFNFEWIGFYSRFRMPEMQGLPWNRLKVPDTARTHYAEEIANTPDLDKPRDITNDYYSFDVGPVHYVVVNSEIYTNPDIPHVSEGEQNEWLRADLAAAAAPDARLKRPWIVVFMHTPMYSANVWSVYHPLEGKLIRDAWEELFYESGVNMIWSGHMHDMERTNPISRNFTVAGDNHRPQGIVYVINGAAGQPSMGPFEYENPRTMERRAWSAYRRNGKGFSRLEVTRERLVTKFLSVSGQVKNESALYDPLWRLKMRCSTAGDPARPTDEQCKLIMADSAAAAALPPIEPPQGEPVKSHDFVVDDIFGGLEEQQVLGIKPMFWNDAATVLSDPVNYRLDERKRVRVRYWPAVVPNATTAEYMKTVMTATDEYYEECRGMMGTHYAQNIHFSEQPMGRPACVSIDRQLNFLETGERSCAGEVNFSIRYNGVMRGPVTGPVTFHVTVADAARLYIDHRKVLDVLSDIKPQTFTVSVNMVEKFSHVFILEYWQAHSGGILLSVEWQYEAAGAVAAYRGPIPPESLCMARRHGVQLDDALQPTLVRGLHNPLPMLAFNGSDGFLSYSAQFYDFLPGMSLIFVFRFRSPNATLFGLYTGWGADDVVIGQDGSSHWDFPGQLYHNKSDFFRTDELGIWTFIHRVNGHLDIYKNNTFLLRRDMPTAKLEYRFLNYLGRSLTGGQGPVDVAEWMLFRFELASEDAGRIVSRLHQKWFTPAVVPPEFAAAVAQLPTGAELPDVSKLAEPPSPPPAVDPLQEVFDNPSVTIPPVKLSVIELETELQNDLPAAPETPPDDPAAPASAPAVDPRSLRELQYIQTTLAKQQSQSTTMLVLIGLAMAVVVVMFSRRGGSAAAGGSRMSAFFGRRASASSGRSASAESGPAASSAGLLPSRSRTKLKNLAEDV